MLRLAELAQPMIASGKVAGIRHAGFTREDVFAAKEAFMAGTTMDVVPVTRFDDQFIGSGKPGPIAEALHQLLLSDIQSGEGMLTPI